MVMGDMAMTVDVVVIGAGAGGCAAAIRGAELGLDVALVDTLDSPGGNYLYNTCIPSQISLKAARHAHENNCGTSKRTPIAGNNIDLEDITARKNSTIQTIATNLTAACKESGVLYIKGKAYFENSNTIRLKDSEVNRLKCKYTIVATGASPTPIDTGNAPTGNRILTPAQALQLQTIPTTLLIVGAGHTGIELAYTYSTLGSEIDVIDEHNTVLPHLDADITAHLENIEQDFFNSVHLSHRALNIKETDKGVEVTIDTQKEVIVKTYEMIILANGSTPLSENLGLENTNIILTDKGFIASDDTGRTNDPAIYAVGDVTNSTMYSNLAARQGQVAAEVISGLPSALDVLAVPCTIAAFDSISWCGVLEREAADKKIPVRVYAYSWKDTPHSIVSGSAHGRTKIIVSADDKRVLGAIIMGTGSSELITQMVLAIEMGAIIDDLSLMLHPHPTFTELFKESC